MSGAWVWSIPPLSSDRFKSVECWWMLGFLLIPLMVLYVLCRNLLFHDACHNLTYDQVFMPGLLKSIALNILCLCEEITFFNCPSMDSPLRSAMLNFDTGSHVQTRNTRTHAQTQTHAMHTDTQAHTQTNNHKQTDTNKHTHTHALPNTICPLLQSRWGRTPIIDAAKNDDEALFELFVDAGANVHASDYVSAVIKWFINWRKWAVEKKFQSLRCR